MVARIIGLCLHFICLDVLYDSHLFLYRLAIEFESSYPEIIEDHF